MSPASHCVGFEPATLCSTSQHEYVQLLVLHIKLTASLGVMVWITVQHTLQHQAVRNCNGTMLSIILLSIKWNLIRLSVGVGPWNSCQNCTQNTARGFSVWCGTRGWSWSSMWWGLELVGVQEWWRVYRMLVSSWYQVTLIMGIKSQSLWYPSRVDIDESVGFATTFIHTQLISMKAKYRLTEGSCCYRERALWYVK